MSGESPPKPQLGKKSSALAARLDRIRQNAGATKLQTIFRGMKARRSMHEIVQQNLSKMKTEVESNCNELESFVDIPFHQLRSVQLCVDAAEGLPLCCTATRVTGRLLTERREQIGDNIMSNCEIGCSPQRPLYSDCIGSWDKSVLLSTSYTFLIRVDTLERPSLAPAVVGYAVIKLCTNKDGKQPREGSTESDPTDPSTGVLLNSGLFKIPLFYGSLIASSATSVLNEFNVQTQLDGKIPGAFIYVRIYDATIDRPARFDFTPRGKNASNGKKSGASAEKKTTHALEPTECDVAMMLHMSMPFATCPEICNHNSNSATSGGVNGLSLIHI